jgi:cell division inhibitor SepF
MPLRDSWHRTLVYFGLAEEADEYDDYEPEPAREPPEAVLADRYRERPNVRRLQGRRRRDNDFDDIFAEEEPAAAPQRPAAVLRSVTGGRAPTSSRGGSAGDFGVHLVIPKSFNDAQQVADKFREGIPVILNLQGIDTPLVMRLIDFASGLTYALDGGMQRIADKVFMLTPRNVELSAEERARLIEKGFFNQA